MLYEIIREIKNSCSGNQMRDIFFMEEDIDDTDAWIQEHEPHADEVNKEEISHGYRYWVYQSEMVTSYTMTEV